MEYETVPLYARNFVQKIRVYGVIESGIPSLSQPLKR